MIAAGDVLPKSCLVIFLFGFRGRAFIEVFFLYFFFYPFSRRRKPKQIRTVRVETITHHRKKSTGRWNQGRSSVHEGDSHHHRHSHQYWMCKMVFFFFFKTIRSSGAQSFERMGFLCSLHAVTTPFTVYNSFASIALNASLTWSNTLSAMYTIEVSPPLCRTLSGCITTSALW